MILIAQAFRAVQVQPKAFGCLMLPDVASKDKCGHLGPPLRFVLADS
jgi:hypothetical protein